MVVGFDSTVVVVVDFDIVVVMGVVFLIDLFDLLFVVVSVDVFLVVKVVFPSVGVFPPVSVSFVFVPVLGSRSVFASPFLRSLQSSSPSPVVAGDVDFVHHFSL